MRLLRFLRRSKAARPEVIGSLDLSPSTPIKPARPDIATGTLLRDAVSAEAVQGTLALRGETFHVLERPWLDNRQNESCIPAGVYHARFMPRSASGKYRNVWHLQDVPGRGGILIHQGNLVAHSRGCLIIGKRRGVLAGKPAVLNSRTALGELNDLMQGQDFTLTIMGDQKWSES